MGNILKGFSTGTALTIAAGIVLAGFLNGWINKPKVTA